MRRLLLIAALALGFVGVARAQNITGTVGALNANVVVPGTDKAVVLITVTGTWNATLSFQFSVDNVNWQSVQVTPINSDGSLASAVNSTTANGAWQLTGASYPQIRVIATAYTSGTATVNAFVSITAKSSQTPSSAVGANLAFNLAQVGGVNVSTGAGAGGTGIPRVTVSNDSSLAPTKVTNGAMDGTVNIALNNGTVTDLASGQFNLYGYHLQNKNNAACYLQTFNLAAASVTLGTTSPWVSIPVPAGVGAPLISPIGLANYATKISYAATTDWNNATGCPTGIQGLLFFH